MPTRDVFAAANIVYTGRMPFMLPNYTVLKHLGLETGLYEHKNTHNANERHHVPGQFLAQYSR